MAFDTVVPAYATVFVIEAVLFLAAAGLALGIGQPEPGRQPVGGLSVSHAV